MLSLFLLITSVSSNTILTNTLNHANSISSRLNQTFTAYTNYRMLTEAYESKDISYKEWDFNDLVLNLSQNMEQKLAKVVKCLSDLRTHAQQLYGQQLPVPAVQITENGIGNARGQRKVQLIYSANHDQNVSLEDSSISLPPDVFINETNVKKDILWSDALINTFSSNYLASQNMILWQYFCSENGVLRLYPATSPYKKESANYDCRFQPWYMEGDGNPRDIIIAFDLSGSMVGWPLKMAQLTSNKILDLISDNDFIGYVGLAEEPKYIDDVRILRRATDSNKERISKQIKKISPLDYADFPAGISAAFDMFEASTDLNKTANCQKILIIFSDGTIQDCATVFEERNSNQSVQVFTFGSGKPRTTVDGLKAMACNNRGKFLTITENHDVNEKTFQFFKLLNRHSIENRSKFSAKWSNAYIEEQGNELWKDKEGSGGDNSRQLWKDKEGSGGDSSRQFILTASAPTYYRINKTGIVGVDIKVKSLISKVENLAKVGVYAIILNNRGNVVYHPKLSYLPKLEKSYSARFAEFEQCLNSSDPGRIEQAILSGESGSIEAKCLYHYSTKLERGREFYIDIQYYYTPIRGYPFFLCLAVPKSFSHEIVANQNLTDFKFKLDSILASNTPTNTGKSIVPWFLKSDNSPYDIKRYNDYVINETAAHYGVVEKIVQSSWRDAGILMIPRILYTNAGLLIYSYQGWLDDKSPNFIDNPSLLASLQHGRTSRINVGPMKRSTGYQEYQSFVVTRNIVVNQGSVKISPAVVGAEFYRNDFSEIIRWGKKDPPHQSLIVDNKGFVIFTEPQGDSEVIGKHLSAVYPQLMYDMLNLRDSTASQTTYPNPIFTNTSYYSCLYTCSTRVPKISRGYRLTSFISHYLKLVLLLLIDLVKSHKYLGSNTVLKYKTMATRCCKTFTTYQLNYFNTATRAWIMKDCDCDKTFYSAPIPETNLILINDMNQDCVCNNKLRDQDNLKGFNVTNVNDLDFGDPTYSQLQCNNDFISITECSGWARGLSGSISLVLCVLVLTLR